VEFQKDIGGEVKGSVGSDRMHRLQEEAKKSRETERSININDIKDLKSD